MTAVIPTQTIPVWTSHAIKIHHLWRWTSSRTTLRSSASLGTLVALHFSQAFLNHMFPFLRMSPPGTSSCSFFTLSGAYRSIDFRRRLKHQDRNVVGVAHGYPLTKTVPMFETWGKIWNMKRMQLMKPRGRPSWERSFKSTSGFSVAMADSRATGPRGLSCKILEPLLSLFPFMFHGPCPHLYRCCLEPAGAAQELCEAGPGPTIMNHFHHPYPLPHWLRYQIMVSLLR